MIGLREACTYVVTERMYIGAWVTLLITLIFGTHYSSLISWPIIWIVGELIWPMSKRKKEKK